MRTAMNIPLLILLGFAAWTLLALFVTVGISRWSRILTGRATITEWRADLPQGSDWYDRAMRHITELRTTLFMGRSSWRILQPVR
jgi:hypothetical protein